jgi:hypothetical protein
MIWLHNNAMMCSSWGFFCNPGPGVVAVEISFNFHIPLITTQRVVIITSCIIIMSSILEADVPPALLLRFRKWNNILWLQHNLYIFIVDFFFSNFVVSSAV